MVHPDERVLLQEAERRARQMQLINEVAIRLSSILNVEDLLQEVVRLIQTTFGYYYVNIHTVDEESGIARCRAGQDIHGRREGRDLRIREEGIIGWVAWSGEPLLVGDVRNNSRYYFNDEIPHTRSEVAVPIKRGDCVIGVLDAQDVRTDAFDANDVVVLETLARQILVAIENVELFEALTRSRVELEQKARALDDFAERAARAQEENRRRIALALHDGISQLLVGARYELETIRTSPYALPAGVGDQLEAVCRVLSDCDEEMRRIIFDLYPPGLEDLGLLAAIQHYVATFEHLFGLDCTVLVLGRPVRFSPDAELVAYRIVQESLTNVFKHARGARVEVTLRFDDRRLGVTVRDNGPGFDLNCPKRERTCFGLESMKRNAERVGTKLLIRSKPAYGTTISFTLSGNAESHQE